MQTQEILTGIQNALDNNSREELVAHIDKVEKAVKAGGCNFNGHEWSRINMAVSEAVNQFVTPLIH